MKNNFVINPSISIPVYKQVISQIEQKIISGQYQPGFQLPSMNELAADLEISKETIKKAQAALNEAGYNCGKPDGIAGKGTAAAVTQYQTDKGLNITGTITHELLISLGVIAE